jgi:hypothetical protein
MYVCMYVCMYVFRPRAFGPDKSPTGAQDVLSYGPMSTLMYKMLLATAGLVIRDAKLDLTVEGQFLQQHRQTTLSSMSSAQTAHRNGPATRQWEGQVRLADSSRETSLSSGAL